MNQKFDELQKLIAEANHIVIIQADNPDGDSLASALALEHVLLDQSKKVSLYCGVETPQYLRYIQGWDRVQTNLPKNFDLAVIVDTSALSLLEALSKSGEIAWLKTKKFAIIDHHMSDKTIDFDDLFVCDKTAVATGEVIYNFIKYNNYKLEKDTAELIAYSILSDSLGLTSEAVSSHSFVIMSELVDLGVNPAQLDNNRRELSKKSLKITHYKGKLLQRIEVSDSVAYLTIPFEEIEEYSHEYNPSVLVLDEMRYIEGVQVAIAFKSYPDGKITAKIRCNYGYKIADQLAKKFGGGGHAYAAGFKIYNDNTASVIQQCVDEANQLIKDNEDL